MITTVTTEKGTWENKHLPHRNRAYTAIWDAVEAGRLKRGKCAVCGSPKTQAHHDGRYISTKNITWLCDKHHRMRHRKSKIEIAKTDDSQHLVWLIVAKPRTLDTDEQWFEIEDIELMSHRFMVKYKLGEAFIFEEHKTKLPDVFVAGSEIAKVDYVLNGREIPKGTWIVTLYIPNPETWKKIQTGELAGASIRGPATLTHGQMPFSNDDTSHEPSGD